MTTVESFTDEGQEIIWNVPDAVSEIIIEAYGARGGTGSASVTGSDVDSQSVTEASGENGGFAAGTYTVSPGDTVTMRIGERGGLGGWPDGGGTRTEAASNPDGTINVTAEGGEGGGSTRVDVEGVTVVHAGGGGGGGAAGAGENSEGASASDAGAGGYAHTQNGEDASATANYSASFSEYMATSTAGGGSSSGGSPFGSSTALEDVAIVAAASSGGGGGGDQAGDGGGVDTARDNFAVSSASGGGGSGTAYVDSTATSPNTSNDATSPNNGSNGEVLIKYEQPPSPPSDLVVTGGSDQSVLEWTNDPDGYDEIEVYRATQSGGETVVDYSLVDTIDGAAESYTDDDNGAGLLDGERYYYRLRPLAGGSSLGWSNEADATTDTPAPTDLSHPVVEDKSAEYAWTANHDNGETRVEYRRAGEGDDWTTYETVDHETETATVDGLLTGEQYEGRVVAQTDHAETEDV